MDAEAAKTSTESTETQKTVLESSHPNEIASDDKTEMKDDNDGAVDAQKAATSTELEEQNSSSDVEMLDSGSVSVGDSAIPIETPSESSAAVANSSTADDAMTDDAPASESTGTLSSAPTSTTTTGTTKPDGSSEANHSAQAPQPAPLYQAGNDSSFKPSPAAIIPSSLGSMTLLAPPATTAPPVAATSTAPAATAATTLQVENMFRNREEFMTKLKEFMDARGTPVEYIPVFDHKELDLWQLFKSVIQLGGFSKVIENKMWRHVIEDLGVDLERTDAGYRLKCHYDKYLNPFERHLFGLPDVPINTRSSPITSPTSGVMNSPQRGGAKRNASGDDDVSETGDSGLMTDDARSGKGMDELSRNGADRAQSPVSMKKAQRRLLESSLNQGSPDPVPVSPTTLSKDPPSLFLDSSSSSQYGQSQQQAPKASKKNASRLNKKADASGFVLPQDTHNKVHPLHSQQQQATPQQQQQLHQQQQQQRGGQLPGDSSQRSHHHQQQQQQQYPPQPLRGPIHDQGGPSDRYSDKMRWHKLVISAMGDAAIERYRSQLQPQAHAHIRNRDDLLTMTALDFGSLEVDESKALRSFFSALRRGYNAKARPVATVGAGKATSSGNSLGQSSLPSSAPSLKRKNGKPSRKRAGNGLH